MYQFAVVVGQTVHLMHDNARPSYRMYYNQVFPQRGNWISYRNMRYASGVNPNWWKVYYSPASDDISAVARNYYSLEIHGRPTDSISKSQLFTFELKTIESSSTSRVSLRLEFLPSSEFSRYPNLNCVSLRSCTKICYPCQKRLKQNRGIWLKQTICIVVIFSQKFY